VVATVASAFPLARPGQRTLTSLDAVTLTKASRCCADALTSASPDGVLGLHATPVSFRLSQSPLAATPGSRSISSLVGIAAGLSPRGIEVFPGRERF